MLKAIPDHKKSRIFDPRFEHIIKYECSQIIKTTPNSEPRFEHVIKYEWKQYLWIFGLGANVGVVGLGQFKMWPWGHRYSHVFGWKV